jgi:transketolase
MDSTRLDSEDLGRRTRASALRMVAAAGAAHIGSSLSCADVLAVLYSGVLQIDPARHDDPARDRFVMSKGHAAAAYYAVLAHAGFFPEPLLEQYCTDGGALPGHVTAHGLPGVELSTGSLGHGLPVAVGLALAASRRHEPWRTYALLSDGECDEGSVWEAALLAGHHRLDRLTAIVDANGLQAFGTVDSVLRLEPLAGKWRAFGWDAVEVDGHDHDALRAAFGRPPAGQPRAVIARTVKGRGVSFMEHELAWHYRTPDPEQLARALDEVG